MSSLMLKFYVLCSMISFVNSMSFEQICDDVRNHSINLGFSIIGTEDLNSEVLINLYLVCELSGFKTEKLDRKIYHGLIDIVDSGSISCIDSILLQESEVTRHIDYRSNFPYLNHTLANTIRFTSLSCKKDFLLDQSADVGDGTTDLVTKSTLDLILGFVRLNLINISSAFDSKDLTRHSFTYMYNITQRLGIRLLDNRHYIYMDKRELVNISEISKLRVKTGLVNYDYLENKVLELETRIRDLRCDGGYIYVRLIEQLSILFTQLKVRLNGYSNNDIFNYRYNYFIVPDPYKYDSMMTWIAFHSTSYTRRSKLMRDNIEEYESENLEYGVDRIRSYVQRVRSLFRIMSNINQNYYKSYYDTLVFNHSVIRYDIDYSRSQKLLNEGRIC